MELDVASLSDTRTECPPIRYFYACFVFPGLMDARSLLHTLPLTLLTILLLVLVAPPRAAEASDVRIWVDAVRGDDSAAATRSRPIETLAEAWQRARVRRTGRTVIALRAGDYSDSSPNYWEYADPFAEPAAPVLIDSVDGRGKAVLPSVTLFRVRDVEFRRVKFRSPGLGGDLLQCERCNGLTLRRVTALGSNNQETVKVNQSSRVTITGSVLRSAGDNVIDLVAVRRARIRNNRISDAGDWCAYAKGGSSDVVVTGNVFTRCGTGGFTAGQGTGFQFMVAPWLHYEAVGVVVRGNTVTDTEGAAFGVNGGFNVLVERNVARNVGSRSHVLEAVYGGRSCDGAPGDPGRERCGQYLATGGWGTTVVDDGTNGVRIPNRNVYFIGNVIDSPGNPDDGLHQTLTVFGALPPQPGSNVPNGGSGDTGLVFERNWIRNGPASMPLGIGDGTGCGSSHPTCSPSRVIGSNRIGRIAPLIRRKRNGRLTARARTLAYVRRGSAPRPSWGALPGGTAPWARWPR